LPIESGKGGEGRKAGEMAIGLFFVLFALRESIKIYAT
jgi:hypothetical protein